jgi:hypothetical protein
VAVSGCSKDSITQSDIAGYDGDMTQIIELPNTQLIARNCIIQVRDKADFSTQACLCYEILFKRRMNFLLSPGDYIPEPYEKVLAYLTLGRMYAKVLNKETATIDPRSAYFTNLGTEILKNCASNEELGQDRMIDTPREQFQPAYQGNF